MRRKVFWFLYSFLAQRTQRMQIEKRRDGTNDLPEGVIEELQAEAAL